MNADKWPGELQLQNLEVITTGVSSEWSKSELHRRLTYTKLQLQRVSKIF